MQLVDTFANQTGGQAAVAASALTDARDIVGLNFGHGYPGVFPAKSAVGYPATFAISGSYPNLDAAVRVIDLKAPFGLEFFDVAVSDDDSLNWVDDHQVSFAQHKLGPNPEQVGEQRNQNRNSNVDGQVSSGIGIENELRHEEGVEQKSNRSPSQIGFWSKNGIHASIIAGNFADGKGK
jgi:hypothetical protein